MFKDSPMTIWIILTVLRGIIVTSAEDAEDTNLCEINACDAMDAATLAMDRLKLQLQNGDWSLQSIGSVAGTTKDPENCNLQEVMARLKLVEENVKSLYSPVPLVGESTQVWQDCSEGPCDCQRLSRQVTCYRKDMKEVPTQHPIPTETEILDLGMNRISSLHFQTFSGLRALRDLDLHENSLQHLPSKIFSDLYNLKHLKLQNNKLERLDEKLFRNLRSLETLDMKMNSISHLPDGLFVDLKHLKTLSLSYNSIEFLPSRILQNLINLEELCLEKNQLVTLDAFSFKNLKKLNKLYLQENRLSAIHMDTFVGLEANLQILRLDKNEIRSPMIPGVFKNLRNLLTLNLDSNGIPFVEPEVFENLYSLTALHLARNTIEIITKGNFHPLTALIDLDLSFNGIETIEANAFQGLEELSKLVLSGNLLQYLPIKVFDGLQRLKELDLQNNRLEILQPGSLSSIFSLSEINLGGNPFHCNCSTSYLTNWLRGHKNFVRGPHPKCVTPPSYANTLLTELEESIICRY